jgi:S1-C subfamily serine protease
MNKRSLILAGGLGALSLMLIALPSPSATSKEPDDSSLARLQQKLQDMRARLEAKMEGQDGLYTNLARAQALATSAAAMAQQEEKLKELLPDGQEFTFLSGEEGSSWLGVETHEVTTENVKELKLPAERGVVLGKVIPDSPAAKSGLKEKDVITEINGQRVEGAAQFRRMIREIPAGRSVQFTVWRDGRSQTFSATLGKAEEGHHLRVHAAPGTFAFSMPEVQELPDMDWSGVFSPSGHPRLGIDAEDLSGQFGNYFGAPEGEGVLVRDVNSGSPAEKAGLKAGDVITSIDGDRVRSVGDLREKLAPKSDDKDRSLKLGVLRNKNLMTLTVELPAPAARNKHVMTHRTNI